MYKVLHGVLTIPQNFQYMMERFIPSLIHVKELEGSNFEYNFHLYAQGLSDAEYESIEHALANVGLDGRAQVTRASFNSTDTRETFGNYLKNRRNAFLKGYDFYISTDDDFEFVEGSFEAYKISLQYLVDNPDCCSVMGTSPMGSGGKDWTPTPYRGLTWMNRGMILRNMENDLPELYDTCISREMLSWDKVTFDDWAVPLHPMTQGYYSAKQFKTPTRHYHMAPGMSVEDYEKSRTIPSHVKDFFRWKLARTDVYTIEQWKETDDYPFFKEMFQLPENFDLTYDKIAKHIWQSDKFINEVYKPAAIARFGQSRY